MQFGDGKSMSNEKILIVDDEKEMCLLVKSFLDNEQFQTYTAYDAASALEMLESVDPDLILLDIMLPGNRQDHCPVGGRGRLYHQAVQFRGADRPHQGAPAQRAPGAAGGSGSQSGLRVPWPGGG